MRSSQVSYSYPQYSTRSLTTLLGAGMQTLCLTGAGFATGQTSYRNSKATGLAPTNTGLAKTIEMAPQARICFPGPSPGTACHSYTSSGTTTGRPIAFVEERQHLDRYNQFERCGDSNSTTAKANPYRAPGSDTSWNTSRRHLR